MKTLMKAGCALLCLLVVSTVSVAADSSDLDNQTIRMSGKLAGSSFEAVAGWRERSFMAKGERECFETGYGQSCYYNPKVATERTHLFGTLQRHTAVVEDGAGYSGGSVTSMQCPTGTSEMQFIAGYELANGTFIPGPAHICAKFN